LRTGERFFVRQGNFPQVWFVHSKGNGAQYGGKTARQYVIHAYADSFYIGLAE
jgi:hypothetical protein